MKKYRLIEHTADLGILVCGDSPGDLFANAACAVFDLMTDLGQVRLAGERRIDLEGADWEDLLVNYLREVLYLFNGEGMLLADFIIADIDPHCVSGSVRGELFDARRHIIKREIKAVTYHGVEVSETGKGWRGKVILDV